MDTQFGIIIHPEIPAINCNTSSYGEFAADVSPTHTIFSAIHSFSIAMAPNLQ